MKEKSKKDKKESPSFFKELGCFMTPYKLKYTFSIILSVISVASNMASYAFAGLLAYKIFDGERDFLAMVLSLIGVVVAKLLSTILLNFGTWLSHKAAYRTLRDIRLAVTQKMLRMPQGYFEENGSGRLKTLLVDRIETMERTLAHMLPELTADILAPLAVIVWMFVIDWRLALISIAWMFLGFSVTGGMMKNYEEKYEGQIKAFKSMNQSVLEYVNGIEVIKNFGRVDDSYEKYKKNVMGHAEYNINWQKETQTYSALGMAIAPFTVLPVLIFGLVFFGNNTIAAPELFLFVILSFAFFTPLMNSMGYFDQLAGMGTNAKEIKEILDYKELERGSVQKVENSNIEFKNVCFKYKEENDQVLKNINFKINEGEVFALVGPSGSGKSTIGKLLSGYWDATEGDIIIGGKKISEYTQEALNKAIAYVDQETYLHEGTILDNIRTGCHFATDDEVIAAAKSAGCDEFIRALPDGYNTETGVAGNRLSGGEKQRIAIARAIMKNSPIVVLDEATSSSDPENEASIQQALSVACKGKTLLVVAHRLRTVMNANTIAYMKNGEIVATGTHEELLKNFKDYRDQWNLSQEV